MKNRSAKLFVSAIILSIISIFSTNSVSAQGNDQVSLDLFYNELSPYGYWDNDPNYGEIWYPQVESNFRPYSSNGYWTMTQYGNTWVSNYSWGWAPFHYGRWVNTPHRGWGWTPGYEWGPAWVDWRSGNGYYGWAPMTPRVSVNVSIGLPINLWIFAPSRRIYDRNIYRYSNHGRPNIYNNTTIINNTYIVNNNHYYGGPARRDVERTLGRRVAVSNVRQDRPASSRNDRVSTSRRSNNELSDRNPSTDRNNVRNNNSNRNTSTERNNVRNNNSNRNDKNISRELYIGRDGNSTLRERNENRTTTQATRRDNNNVDNKTRAVQPTAPSNRKTDQNIISDRTKNSSPSAQDRVNTQRSPSTRQTTISRGQRQQPQVQQAVNIPQRERQSTASSPNGRGSTSTNNSSRVGNTSRENSSQVSRSSSSSARGNTTSTTSRAANERGTGRGSR